MENKFEGYQSIEIEEMHNALSFAVKQIVTILPEFTEKFQKAYSEDGFYKPIENVDWTTGFWTGEIWLAYEYVKENPDKIRQLGIGTPEVVLESLRVAGEIQIQSFYHRIENKIEVDHHDMGFLYSPSCVAGYNLIKSEAWKKAAIMAA